MQTELSIVWEETAKVRRQTPRSRRMSRAVTAMTWVIIITSALMAFAITYAVVSMVFVDPI